MILTKKQYIKRLGENKMKQYNFRVKLINKGYITVEADSFDEAVDKVHCEAGKLAKDGSYEFYSIDEDEEEEE